MGGRQEDGVPGDLQPIGRDGEGGEQPLDQRADLGLSRLVEQRRLRKAQPLQAGRDGAGGVLQAVGRLQRLSRDDRGHRIGVLHAMLKFPRDDLQPTLGLHRGRRLDHRIQEAVNDPVLVQQGRVTEGEVGLPFGAVPGRREAHVLDEGGVARHRLLGQGADVRPDVAPHFMHRLAQGEGLHAQHGGIAVVVDHRHLGPPADQLGEVRAQDEIDDDLEGDGPVGLWPEWSRRPVEGFNLGGHVAGRVGTAGHSISCAGRFTPADAV